VLIPSEVVRREVDRLYVTPRYNVACLVVYNASYTGELNELLLSRFASVTRLIPISIVVGRLLLGQFEQPGLVKAMAVT
jgi:hypothetical protein